MTIIRPRLNDFFNLPFTQEEVDFAIPFIDEDIPLYIDPFLLWKSPSQQDRSLHLAMVNHFNKLGQQFKAQPEQTVNTLIELSECREIGLGSSKTKQGKKIGKKTAGDVLSLFEQVPQISKGGVLHIEEIQLLVDQIAQDRISDISANFLKSFLIDFTCDACEKRKIPMSKVVVSCINDESLQTNEEELYLPVNPNSSQPIIFVPKRWLRYSSFINYDDYFKGYYVPNEPSAKKKEKIQILNFNRHNYDMVSAYLKVKEHDQLECKNDPLFSPIPQVSAKRKLDTVLKLPTGKSQNADKIYENNLCPLLASLLYPHLDFAAEQSRTESGVLIRDLIFYNNQSYPFLKEMYEVFNCRQIVFELKNVLEVSTDHVDQLNRYLKESFGKFGIVFTRNPPPKNVVKNLVDLWSGQRKCILVMTDEHLKMMCELYNSRQRNPIDVVHKAYVEFTRLLPS